MSQRRFVVKREEIENNYFSHDNPAHYDQSTSELAEKIQKADGFIVFVYTRTNDEDESYEGHCTVGMTPGLSVTDFLAAGVTDIQKLVDSVVQGLKNDKESFSDDETEG
jgi:hypothetical protein